MSVPVALQARAASAAVVTL
jgi:hypothetical protein